MKRPRRRKAAISPKRVREWMAAGRYYRYPPDEATIQEWLRRFSEIDRDVAARLLDCVQVVSEQQILVGYKKALKKLAGWDREPDNRTGRWFFVGFGKSGESGQAMLRAFREANQLSSSIYDDLFCGASELPYKGLTLEDHVVFVDDFSGSGRQICNVWPTLQEIIAADAKCHLILTAATRWAIKKIQEATNLSPIAQYVLEEEDNIFSPKCRFFSNEEKTTVEKYGKKADRKNPRGYGGCGLLFVLCHKTPNNTIPILHVYHHKWHGIFPRYLPL